MGDDDYVPFEGRTEVRSMSSTDGEMPPGQAKVFAQVPVEWADIPRIGVHGLILRALKNRGVVETRWLADNRCQWRRTP